MMPAVKKIITHGIHIHRAKKTLTKYILNKTGKRKKKKKPTFIAFPTTARNRNNHSREIRL